MQMITHTLSRSSFTCSKSLDILIIAFEAASWHCNSTILVVSFSPSSTRSLILLMSSTAFSASARSASIAFCSSGSMVGAAEDKYKSILGTFY